MLYMSVLRLLTDSGEIRYGSFRRKAVENLDEFRYCVCNESHILFNDATEMFPYIRLSRRIWIVWYGMCAQQFVVRECRENSEYKRHTLLRGVKVYIHIYIFTQFSVLGEIRSKGATHNAVS
jgi:chloramphenicol O-acetyltransferase